MSVPDPCPVVVSMKLAHILVVLALPSSLAGKNTEDILPSQAVTFVWYPVDIQVQQGQVVRLGEGIGITCSV